MATPKLNLSDLFSGQAQAYFTINENNRCLEVAAAGVLHSKSLSAAPAGPPVGAAYYIAGTPPTGDPWDGHAGEIAVWESTDWLFFTIPDHSSWFVIDENATFKYNGGGSWTRQSAGNPSGKTYINPATTTYTLTAAEAANATIMIDGTTVTTVEFPVVDGAYWEVINNSANDVNLKTVGGTGQVLVFAGKRTFVTCDGANLITAQDSFPYGFKMGGTLELPVYSVASTPASAAFGALIFVSDGNAGAPCLAVWDGGGWKRVALGAAISTV